MDPLEEKQGNQTQQEKPKQGLFNQGINSVNNIMRTRSALSNPFNKIGSRLALQAGRSLFTFLAASPWFWTILAILIVVIFTFVIVMGFGGSIPSDATPTIAPTKAITPTPAVP